MILLREAYRGARHLLGTSIGRHNQDDVAEIRFTTVVVGQLAVIHYLQQQVENFGVRFLNLIEQHHSVWILGHRFRQQATLIETDIARRCANQPGHCMPLHVLRHIESNQFDAHAHGQLPGHFRLANTRRSGQQE